MREESLPVAGSSQKVGRAGFFLHWYESLASTNDTAVGMPSWSAVAAREQTCGRGRQGRRFESSGGGLWLSAVLPAEGGIAAWNGFSLAMGLSVLRTLQGLGLEAVRLRWPNDLMVGEQKLAGLLIEHQHTLVAGIGINIFNRPWEDDPHLMGSACRLADLLDPCPEVEVVAVRILDAIADAHEALPRLGLASIIQELNSAWTSRPVCLRMTDGSSQTGDFRGLDPEGNVLLSTLTIPHQNISQLTEIN